MAAPLLPPGTSAWVVTDGKIGDEVQCFGLAEAMGLAPQCRLIRPRAPWWWVMPYGPIDPGEASHRPGSPLAPPFPDVLLAAGRRTVPYMRHVKRLSPRTFTIFIKDPYTGLKTADLIWVPEHDRLRGDNVIVTLTPANRLGEALFAQARAAPDLRMAHVPRPRLAMVLGGPSVNFAFDADDARNLAALARDAVASGHGVVATPSRRTPAPVTQALREALEGAPAFVWDGEGANPYVDILANSDVILVTSDSVNMIGEAVTTGKPVYVYEPAGKGHAKMTALVESLVAKGAVRRFAGSLAPFAYEPIVSTPVMAAEAARRYRAFRGANPLSRLVGEGEGDGGRIPQQ